MPIANTKKSLRYTRFLPREKENCKMVTRGGWDMKMNKFILPRDRNQPPIEFVGHLLGTGQAGLGAVGTRVDIYKTQGGKYICHINQWKPRWSTDSHRVGIVNTPREVVVWLQGDARGRLGEASILAIEDATKREPGFSRSGELVEHEVKPDVVT